MKENRRTFLKHLGIGALGVSAWSSLPQAAWATPQRSLFFEISLAQFSFASDFFSGKLNTLDFPALAKKEFDIHIVEYVSMFFADRVSDVAFLKELKSRADDLGVTNHLIMVDDENLADLNQSKRNHAVESHYKWIDAAKILGCKSIRVNLGGMEQEGSPEEVAKAAVEGYGKLLEFGERNDLDIIVENHMGYSCNGQWLAAIMKEVNHQRAGVLPDFGNFCIRRTQPKTYDIAGFMETECVEEYDKYKGVEELMPYAKGVSAKSHQFDEMGNETEIDFERMFDIIRKSGFTGIVGIEYEGGLMHMMGKEGYLDNADGVRSTQKLLERVGKS